MFKVLEKNEKLFYSVAAGASGDTNPVSALEEVVASVFDVDLDEVCDTSLCW